MSPLLFYVTASDHGLPIGPARTRSDALSTAWQRATARPGTTFAVAPVGRERVLSLEWKYSRVVCRSVATGRRLTYAEALAVLEAVPDAL